MTKPFKSKVSYGILVPMLILAMVPAINMAFREVSTAYLITVLLISLALVALVLNLFLGMVYNIREDKELEIKTGVFHKFAVEITDITSITKSSSILP